MYPPCLRVVLKRWAQRSVCEIPLQREEGGFHSFPAVFSVKRTTKERLQISTELYETGTSCLYCRPATDFRPQVTAKPYSLNALDVFPENSVRIFVLTPGLPLNNDDTKGMEF